MSDSHVVNMTQNGMFPSLFLATEMGERACCLRGCNFIFCIALLFIIIAVILFYFYFFVSKPFWEGGGKCIYQHSLCIIGLCMRMVDIFHYVLFPGRPGAYDLFKHNCNNFSDEVSQFLCGHGIPKHILQLPDEVLNT